MLKKCKVVMLSTNEKAECRTGYYKDVINLNNSKYDKSLELFRSTDGINIPNPQHLYFLSDEEIKEGDWCILNLGENSRPVKIKSLNSGHPVFTVDIGEGYAKLENLKKIIATTDSSLRIGKLEVGGKIEHLPQISQSFIGIFVEEYNKDNVITEVMIEYKEPYNKLVGSKIGSNIGHFTLTEENKYRLKINANNTINIKPIISTSEEIGEKIVQYCKKYEGTNKYNDVLKAIEFGYQLSLNKDEK